MTKGSTKWMVGILLIAVTAAANCKLMVLRELVFTGIFQAEQNIEQVAERIRAEESIYSPDEVANLLVVSNDRSTERYMFNFYSLFSILTLNLFVFAYFFGYYHCWRKARKSFQSGK